MGLANAIIILTFAIGGVFRRAGWRDDDDQQLRRAGFSMGFPARH